MSAHVAITDVRSTDVEGTHSSSITSTEPRMVSPSTVGLRPSSVRIDVISMLLNDSSRREWVGGRVGGAPERVAVDVVDDGVAVGEAQRRVLLVRPRAVAVHRDAH